MSVRFLTETGSLYEYDPSGKRVRRLYGKTQATARMGVDEEWKPATLAKNPEVGKNAIIIWGDDVAPLVSAPGLETALKTTVTSQVVEINPQFH